LLLYFPTGLHFKAFTTDTYKAKQRKGKERKGQQHKTQLKAKDQKPLKAFAF
jgi:hypothetical protein